MMEETTPLSKAQKWANDASLDEAARKEIQILLESNDEPEITERFYKDLEFGTGGLRGILGMGSNRINRYTVRQATVALGRAVIDSATKTEQDELSMAISYDSRNFSFEFAKECASVLAGLNIKSYIFDRLNPVPLLSFSVRHHKANAGIMITASHNPPKYNGYKAFWADGAQVTPPNDQNVIDNFNSVSDFGHIPFMDFDEAVEKKIIVWVGAEIEEAYNESIKTGMIRPDLVKEKGNDLSICYTPIHGTGLHPVSLALKGQGFNNLHIVPEQSEPNGDFPTVTSPNPENPEALAMGVELMKKTDSDVCFGSDPDTDRLGVAVAHKGEVVYLNGNQIGTLLLHYILSGLKEQNRMPSNPYFVKTIVTTELQDKIAKSFGVEVENTLTGFKWICRRMEEIKVESPERNFLFGTEESYGYLNHEYIRDKDGVSSLALMAEAALYYKTQGLTLIEALNEIYEAYGFSHETLLNLNYEGKAGAEKIQRIMAIFRNNKKISIPGEEIEQFEDYQEKVSYSVDDSGKVEKKGTINLPASNVIGLHFKSGNKLFLRPSGTEPKIKFYLMNFEKSGALEENKARSMEKSQQCVDFITNLANNA
jgi:phosphoglucomutase